MFVFIRFDIFRMRGLMENVFLKGHNFLNNKNFILNSVRKENTNPKTYIDNHKVNNLERRFLVWTGKYKTLEEVPALVP